MNSIVKNKEKLQNTKKIKGIVKRFSILTLSLIFLFSSFVYADNASDIVLAPTSVIGANVSSAYFCGTNGSSSPGWNVYIASNDIPVYLFSVNNQVCVASETSTHILYQQCENRTNTIANATLISFGTDFSYDSTSGLYYLSGAFNLNRANYLMNYSTLSDGLSAVNTFIQNQSPNIRFPFTLQNGYLFVYDCGQSNSMYSFDLSSKSEEYSDIGSIPFPDTNQSYWFSDSLPEIDETSIPASTATIISWQKGDKTNIFGQTQYMIASISGISTGRYLYIYNPPVHYKWSGSSNPTASETINYPMIINGVSENENWYIYDSVARLTDFNQGGSVTGTVTGENIIGSVSSDGAISLVTSSGSIYTQNSGGSTDISGANGGSLVENINGLKETLDNFVNQFIQLLSAPISHIQQLIQSSNQFFDVFSQLFEWLPSELSSVIVSGLIIMVVIGVIKMLL